MFSSQRVSTQFFIVESTSLSEEAKLSIYTFIEGRIKEQKFLI